MDESIPGGECLCGKVKFSFPKADESAHCHCRFCQRAHGAAFVTWVVVAEAQFSFKAGEDHVRWFTSSQQSKRGFCPDCGSTMFFKSALCPGEIHVARANLTVDADLPVQCHCFIEQKAPWLTVNDDLKQLTGDSPELDKYKKIRP